MGERTVLYDDLDHTIEEGVERREFTLGDKVFAVDLVEPHWENFKKILEAAKILDEGKPAKRAPRKKTATKQTRPPADVFPPTPGEVAADRQIRQWARANGYDVGERGRISDETWAAYREDQATKTNGATIHTS